MLSPIHHRRNSQLALAIISGLLNVLLFPKFSYSWLAWVFLTPLLIAVYKECSVPRAFLLGWISGGVFFSSTCYWITVVLKNYGGLGWLASAAVFFLLVIYLACFYGLFTLFFARLSIGYPACAIAMAPPLWVSTEFARAHFLTGFPWCLLGYSLVDYRNLAQVSTLTGVYGLSFLLILSNALLADTLISRSRKSILRLGVALMGIYSISFLWKVPATPPENLLDSARIVQTDIRLDQDWSAQARIQLLDELSQLSISRTPVESDRAKDSFRLILWPETPTPFYFNHDPDFREQLQSIAKTANSYFLFGFVDFRNTDASQQEEVPVNSVGILAPSGKLISQYDKVHLVPFGEYIPYPKLFSFINKISTEAGNFVPGDTIVVSQLQNGQKLGTFICYEAIFPDLVRRFALHGAEVFVNVTNDSWFGDSSAPSQHFYMARMRAIENRRFLLRAANDGISAIVNPYGEVLYRAKRFERTALEGRFDMRTDRTLYMQFGDLFAWICLVLSGGVLCLVTFMQRFKTEGSISESKDVGEK